MLRKFKLYVILMLTMMSAHSVTAFTPTPQQIEQFKNMPRAQQEALARQMGIDLSDFQIGSQNGGNQQQTPAPSEQVQRSVNEGQISKKLSEQSVAKERTKELKPFGYNLFSTANEDGSALNFAPASNIPVPADYVMGPGDSVNVQLFGKETGQFELFVNNEGTIQIPDLGPMSVVGMTYQQLKKELVEKYNQQVIGVTPHITMGALRTIQVYLVGEAYRPGAFTLSSLSTITHALFASGGVSEIGSLRNIQLKRAGKTVVTFDLYDLLIFGNTANDVRLQQGDVIFIPTVQKLVSIDGNVRRPAIYEAKPGEALSTLLNVAGGVLPSGAANMVQIARKTPTQGLEVKTVNVLTQEGKSASVANGDYITIPDSSTEFNNAIVVIGAHTSPGLIQWKQGMSLSSIVNEETLLKSSDLEYGLILRKKRFASQSEVIQFEPRNVLNRTFDLPLEAFDQITLFNRFAIDDNLSVSEAETASDARRETTLVREFRSLESELVEGDLKASQDKLDGKQGNYLQKLELASFTEKQLLLKDTQNYSRNRLLAPIIARLKDEGTQSFPVKLAEVTGQVKYPGVYPIPERGRVRELILASGGLIESAFVGKAELSRTQLDVENSYKVQHVSIDLTKALKGTTSDNVELESKDTLNVLRTPDWYDNRRVELIGEVVFPGVYQIKKNETLAQVIKRAGGFTSEASVRAAIFTREELKEREKKNLDKTVEELKQQIITSNISGSQNVKTIDYESASEVLSELLSVEPVGRLVIDLPEIVKGVEASDIPLQHGDKLYVPSISSSVSVIGEVFVPTTHILDEHISLREYIERSGGLTERADDSKIYVVKANGSVKVPSNNFWFDGEDIALEPGDTIVVPRDVVNYERLGLWQTVTQIFYQSVVALVAIGRL